MLYYTLICKFHKTGEATATHCVWIANRVADKTACKREQIENLLYQVLQAFKTFSNNNQGKQNWKILV